MFWLTALLVAVIPNFPRLVPPVIFVIGVNWLLGLVVWKPVPMNFSPVSVVFMVFYLLYLLGITYTEPDNYGFGFFDLEVKLSFLVFPLFYGFAPLFSKQRLFQLVKIFVFSVVVSGLWHLGRNVLFPGFVKGGDLFFGHDFTSPLHYGYYALYVNVAVLFSIALFILHQKKGDVRKWLYALTTVVLSFFLLLTTSKAGILSYLLLALLILSWIGITEAFPGKRLILLISGGFFVFFSIVMIRQPEVNTRFKEVIRQLEHPKGYNRYGKSTKKRIQAWRTALDIGIRNPVTGVGTGDIKTAMKSGYIEKKYEGALQHNLNAHNQFLQVLATLGIPGLICLIFVFFHMFRSGYKNRNIFLIGFCVLCLAFAMTESFLEVQAGVVFFTFFAILLSQFNNQHS